MEFCFTSLYLVVGKCQNLLTHLANSQTYPLLTQMQQIPFGLV